MTARPDPQARLAPEMHAVLDRMAAEDGPQPDPTTLPPAEGRALAEAANRRWNTGLPRMARELIVETAEGRRAQVYIPVTDGGTAAILPSTAGAGPSARPPRMRARRASWRRRRARRW